MSTELHETTSMQNERFRTHIPKSEPKHIKHTAIEGSSVWKWPEFQALIKRLGVDLESPTTSITIEVSLDKLVSVTHEFYGLDTLEEKK